MIDGGLRKIFRAHLPMFHWVSVETGLIEQGVPDSNACCSGVEFWIEYKLSTTNAVHLRPEQIGWHERRFRAGGHTFVAIRFRHSGGPRKGVARDCLYIYRGAAVRSLALSGLSVTPLVRFDGGPARWDWTRLRELLLS